MKRAGKRVAGEAIGLVVGVCLVAALASAQDSLSIDDLGGLALEFEPAAAAAERPGTALLLEVRPYPGDAFELRLPFQPNRIQPLVPQGAAVAAGTAIARVRGPEVGLWLAQARATQRRFAEVRKRYEANRPLYEQGALSSATWSEISAQYLDLEETVRHIDHALEVLQPSGLDEGSAALSVPVAGRVEFTRDAPGGMTGEQRIATIVSDDALRLVGRVAIDEVDEALALVTDGCRVAVAHVEQQAQRLYRQIWSDHLGACPDLARGALRSGYLVHAFDGQRVPRAAVFRLEGQAGVVVRQANRLRFVAVTIASEDRDVFYLRGEGLSTGAPVLVRSVSAVQGLLLGIGID